MIGLIKIVRIARIKMHCSRTILSSAGGNLSTTKNVILSQASKSVIVSICYDSPKH